MKMPGCELNRDSKRDIPPVIGWRETGFTDGVCQLRPHGNDLKSAGPDDSRMYPMCGMRSDGSLDTVHSKCAAAGLLVKAEATDHVHPLSRGGSMWDSANHLSLCTACNSAKGSRTRRWRGKASSWRFWPARAPLCVAHRDEFVI